MEIPDNPQITAQAIVSPGDRRAGRFELPDEALIALGAILAYTVCLLIVIDYKDFWSLVWFGGDNSGYIAIARTLTEWNLHAVGKVKLFWGTGYGIAATHFLTRLNLGTSLLFLSFVCGAISIFFSYRLYGAGVAAWFAFISATYIERILTGGAEPLFVALFLGAFLAIRKGEISTAALCAALAATVRPIGVFVLAAILFMQLRRRDWRHAAISGAIGAAVAAMYAAPLILLGGNPFGNVIGYSEDWSSRIPVTIPFYTLASTTLHTPNPISNILKIMAWFIGLMAVILYYGILRGRIRASWKRYPEETLACLLVILFHLSYNSGWGWAEFPRFIIPVIPFLLDQTGIERPRPYLLLAAAPLFGILGAVQIVSLQKLAASVAARIGH